MKTGKSLTELAAELDRQNKEKHDYVASTTHLEMKVEDDRTKIGGDAKLKLHVDGHGEFPLREIAHDQIAGRLQIPSKYYDRMRTEAPALLARNVNHWFREKPEARMVRTMDGSARAFLSDRFRPIENYDIGRVTIETLLGMKAKVESAEITEKRMYIKAFAPALTTKIPIVGDVVSAGIIVTNSEVGHGAFKVEPMVMVLRCTNGLIANMASMKRYHVGRRHMEFEEATELFTNATREADDKVLMMKARDIVQGAFQRATFEAIVQKMSDAFQNKITAKVVDAVEVTREKFGLRDEEKDDILQVLIRRGDLSQYGLVDAITEASQRVDDYDRATELERLGGVVLELPQRDWSEIAEAKAA